MLVSETWPHIEDTSESESDQHRRLKNLAVRWLLSRGFEASDIEQEFFVESKTTGTGGYGHTDIYAQSDEGEVYVECETSPTLTRAQLSKGGQLPARSGKNVFLVNETGIYRVTYEERTLTDRWDGNPTTRKCIGFERYRDLPMVDLRAFE